MIEENNTDVMNKVMNSFFKVIGKRTTPAHAWLTLKILIGKLTYNYSFLNDIYVKEINDIKEMEYYDTNMKNIVKIKSDVINNVNRKMLGKAIQSLSDELIKNLGKKAGYHLLCEFRYDIGNDYYSLIKSMGVDLHLEKLQNDLYGWISEENLTEEKNAKQKEIIEEII
jgi:hypothetical protein